MAWNLAAKPWMTVAIVLVALMGLLTVSGSRHSSLAPPSQTSLSQSWGQLPLSFEVNEGQTDSQVEFLARGQGYTLFLKPTEAVLALTRASADQRHPDLAPATDGLIKSSEPNAEPPTVVRMRLVGANASANVTGHDQLPGKTNYFIGNDPGNWQTNVSTYAKVSYEDVYPGIDLVYYGAQGQLEYDFIVAPGADPDNIALSIAGADSLRLDQDGNLVLSFEDGALAWQAPFIYQEADGLKELIAGGYLLRDGGEVGFEISGYDSSRPLTIDPVLVYSSYLGGVGNEIGHDIAVDGDGSAYVTGWTQSSDFPTAGALDDSYNGNMDAFVTKVNAAGSALVYSTYLGTASTDQGGSIAVDASGNAYVMGRTTTTGFPSGANAGFDGVYGGGSGGDIFFAKLAADGASLIYSTYIGSVGSEGTFQGDLGGIAIDQSGNAYVTSWTDANQTPTFETIYPDGTEWQGSNFNRFPITSSAFQTNKVSGREAFITKIDPSVSGQNSLLYSSFLGGTLRDEGVDIAVDSAGRAHITGFTHSVDFATTTDALQVALGGDRDAFLTVVDPVLSGSASLVYSTYFGGSSVDSGTGVALDTIGNSYVTGWTVSASSTFPFTLPGGAFQPQKGDSSDAFVAKIDTSQSGTSALIYFTYLGGNSVQVVPPSPFNAFTVPGEDVGTEIAVDNSGNAYVTGYTKSLDFPILAAVQTELGLTDPAPNSAAGYNYDAFVTVLNPSGTALVYSTYLGGAGYETGNGITVDGLGNAYITGTTGSTDLPTASFDSTIGGAQDAFVAKISWSLLGYWPADGTADDIVGGNDGTLKNGASFAAGKVGQAFALDGSNQYVQTPFSHTGPFTVAFWAKAATTNQTIYTTLFASGSPSNDPRFFQIDFDGSGNYRFNAGPSDNLHVQIGAATTNFQHVVVTYDGSLVKTYQDGVFQTQGTWVLSTLAFVSPSFGKNRDSSKFFNGEIDEVKIYEFALSSAAVLAAFDAVPDTTPSLCPPGTYNPDTGSSPCQDAPPGSFVDAEGATGSTLCDPGTYSAGSGAIGCTDAEPGSYVAGPGATGSTFCEAGTYSPEFGSISADDCLPDGDGDTILDITDNCILVPNLGQADADGNGVGDACDTINVTTTDDELNADGDCSLREAIEAANTDAAVDACTPGSGADTITVPAGTYTLTIGGGEDTHATSNAIGDLDITDDLTINGASSTTMIIRDGTGSRVLSVIGPDTVVVTISNLTIRDGNAPAGAGGGILKLDAALTLNHVNVIANAASFCGGISNEDGSLTLNNSTVEGNIADAALGAGGGICNFADTADAELTLNNSTVSGNTAVGDVGGGIRNNSGGGGTATATLTDSTVSGNTAVVGGGIWNIGNLTLTNSTVSGNTSTISGGGITNFSGGTLTINSSTVIKQHGHQPQRRHQYA